MRYSFFTRLTLVTLLSVAMSATYTVHAQSLQFFRIGTGGTGGTYFPVGTTIASAISNPPGSRACEQGGACGVPGLIAIPQSTNASVQNNALVNNGAVEAGMTAADTLISMYEGSGNFTGEPHPKLRVVANLFPENLHLVLPVGESLSGLADLAGKRVGIAPDGSGTQVAVLQMLEVYGVTRDDIDEAELNNSESAARMAQGQLDAYFYVAGWPVAAMVELASSRGMSLYSFSDEELAKINAIIPSFIPSQIPGGVYEGVTENIMTPAVSAMLVVSVDQPVNLIYEITKSLWNDKTRELLDGGHDKGKLIRVETALAGVLELGVPLHPGAEKFYKEAGLLR